MPPKSEMSISPLPSQFSLPPMPPSPINKHDINFLLTSPPPNSLSLPSLSPPLFSPLSSPPSPSLSPFNPPSSHSLPIHTHTTHRPKPYACKVCDKRFAERGNANKHYRVAHLKQRNHRCQTCFRSFAFRDGLNRHISMVHLNQRPFQCTECMCPAGPHGKALQCTHICGMRFKQKSHRRRHVLSVHHGGGKRVEGLVGGVVVSGGSVVISGVPAAVSAVANAL